jgi:hypothetical protein
MNKLLPTCSHASGPGSTRTNVNLLPSAPESGSHPRDLLPPVGWEQVRVGERLRAVDNGVIERINP